MNKAVELMSAWGDFDAQHPSGSLEDFCRHYLRLGAKSDGNSWKSDKWPSPVTIDFALMRLTGRIVKLLSIFSVAAAEGTGINTFEEFSLLNSVHARKEPRKTEAIYGSLFELSTGTDMLNRLKRIGFISEYDDTEDRRSKRVKLTPKGRTALADCRKRIEQLAEMMFHDLSKDDKLLCIQLLTGVDTKFSELWQSHKGSSFDDLYQEVIRATQSKTKQV